MELGGLHHITPVTGDAPSNVEFYTRVLGMRLVKKTVNQDDVSDGTTDLTKYSAWASDSTIALESFGDEVLLLDDLDRVVDVLTYELGTHAGCSPAHSGAAASQALHRKPKDADTNNCSTDFTASATLTQGDDPP